ncbi:hypothetical protein Dimus_001817 [Dionaea muscipula]
MRKPSSSWPAPQTTSKAAAGNKSSTKGNCTTKVRTAATTPCCSKVGIKRGPWTPEEDQILANYIHKEGEGRWRTLPKRAGLLRCGKSCRLRWMNYLRPSLKKGGIAPDEEDLILRLHRLLGNRWSLIAGRIPGRTDNEIKNYWNTHISKKLISQGIDPRTHKPLNSYPDSSTMDTSINNEPVTGSYPNYPNPITIPSSPSVDVNPAAGRVDDHHDDDDPRDPLKGAYIESTRGIVSTAGDQDIMQHGSTSLFLHGGQNYGYGNTNNAAANINNEVGPQIGFDYGNVDDMLSSFFIDPLVNEDLFTNQHQQPLGAVNQYYSMTNYSCPTVCSSTGNYMHFVPQSGSSWDDTLI